MKETVLHIITGVLGTVSKKLVKRIKKLERCRIETIQTILLLKSAKQMKC